jgi:acetolactate synthase-1/2/3 large subunit
MPGMHGSVPANYALREADLILTLGGRFDDRVAVRGFADGKRIAHVDIDPSEIDKVIKCDLALVAPLGRFLEHALAGGRGGSHPEWMARIAEWREQMPLPYASGDYIKPQAVIECLSELTAGEATLVTGVGQHQMWAAQYYGFRRPRQWISSGGLGTMGFGLPAAIGAWFARPEHPVVLVDGDGSFQMNMQELATVVANRIPVKIFVLNNSFLGMVRQWEDMMDDGHHHETCLARQWDCDADCTAVDQNCRRQLPNLSALSSVYPRLQTLRVRLPGQLREIVARGPGGAGPGAGGRLGRQGRERAADGAARAAARVDDRVLSAHNPPSGESMSPLRRDSVKLSRSVAFCPSLAERGPTDRAWACGSGRSPGACRPHAAPDAPNDARLTMNEIRWRMLRDDRLFQTARPKS